MDGAYVLAVILIIVVVVVIIVLVVNNNKAKDQSCLNGCQQQLQSCQAQNGNNNANCQLQYEACRTFCGV